MIIAWPTGETHGKKNPSNVSRNEAYGNLSARRLGCPKYNNDTA